MTKVTWDAAGERIYQTGVDRGMFYTAIAIAVPWDGLVKVTEAPSGGDALPFYVDGKKVVNVTAGEDFSVTLEAVAAPIEFAPCGGWLRLSNGLFASEQPKQPFSFSYRTLIGSDTLGTSEGYKVHVVYNAVAKNADFVHKSDAASPGMQTFSWNISCTPVTYPGYRPTAHIVIDSTDIDPDSLASIEAILYGDDDNDPRLPALSELLSFISPAWWDLTGLSDFPGGAKNSDLGVDFSSFNLYSDNVSTTAGFWWDLTGLSDFPLDAKTGDWGIDMDTGNVYKKG